MGFLPSQMPVLFPRRLVRDKTERKEAHGLGFSHPGDGWHCITSAGHAHTHRTDLVHGSYAL